MGLKNKLLLFTRFECDSIQKLKNPLKVTVENIVELQEMILKETNNNKLKEVQK
jgi:hypothetical protein